MVQRLILRSFQSPGDIVMLTAAVRDLHLAHPGQYQTDVRTSAPDLWENNPRLSSLKDKDSGVRVLDMHYPLIHQSNHRPYHFIHGYPQYLEQQLGVNIPVTKFAGDVHLSAEEKSLPCPGVEQGVPERFWILMAGGKYDFTAKWWNPASFQAVVDHFQGRITFVQCGEARHWHPPLRGVVNLVGQTKLREFVRLMYHAEGVLCPVTLAMHLAAAVETKPGRPKHRACVVVAGGREPAQWEAYPHHQYLSNNGMFACCQEGGCWKSRCQPVGDGDAKDRQELCLQPVQITPDLRIAQCLEMITPEDVIRRIEMYYEGGLFVNTGHQAVVTTSQAATRSKPAPSSLTTRRSIPAEAALTTSSPTDTSTYRVRFYHGLGDCAYFAKLILLYVKRGHQIAVECTPEKRILFETAGATVIATGAELEHAWGYPTGGTHHGQGKFWQGSKPGHNISELPLPDIGSKAELWAEFCASAVDVTPRIPAKSFETVDRWLKDLPRPIVLLHTKGNTAQNRKSLPDAIAADFYKELLDRTPGTLVLLDWDRRVPRLASHRVRHLDDFGACDLDTLYALMARSQLLIGVDSGPLHAAQLTQIPSVGIWMPGHYPTTYTLPRRQQLNIVLQEHTHQWNRFKRIPWNLIEHPGSTYNAETLAEICAEMLQSPRYLPAKDIAADVQLQRFIRGCRLAQGGNSLAAYADRHTSFDVLFREASQRFERPTFVETGTIRSPEDWAGAGFFTYLAGAYLHRRGGQLHSLELDPVKCEFAREWTSVFGQTVTVHTGDSLASLTRFTSPIDVLYLDSLDTTEPGHAEHCVQEFEAAQHCLHDRSLIVIDDTPWLQGAFVGKGARLVPQLLKSGWRILYAGYQVLLSR